MKKVFFLAILCGVHIRSKSIEDSFSYVLNGDCFQWPSKSVRNVFSSSGRYLPRNIIPTRFQTKGLYAVIAFPRLRPGVPVTLGRIPLLANRRVPEVTPFPSWDMQEEGNADAIQNAVDVFLDEKSVLWVLDSGIVNTLEVPVYRCHPKVLGFDFYTGKLLHEFDLSKFVTPASKFQYVVAENCSGRPFVYISCGETCSVIVYDVQNKKGIVIPLPDAGIKGDILYMVMIKPSSSEPVLVFSHLSYPNLLGLKTNSLRKGCSGNIVHLGQKTGEMIILGTDRFSKIYFRWKGDHRVRAWELGKNGEMGVVVDSSDGCRTSTHVAAGSRLFTWTLDSNFFDFIEGKIGCVGASACLRPLAKNK